MLERLDQALGVEGNIKNGKEEVAQFVRYTCVAYCTNIILHYSVCLPLHFCQFLKFLKSVGSVQVSLLWRVFSGGSRGGSQGAMEPSFDTKLLICLLYTE